MSQTTTPGGTQSPVRRAAHRRLLWTTQVVAALGFLVAAADKLSGEPQVVATFDALGWGDWIRYLLAALEVAGAAALLVPRTAGLAGLAFVALTIGAVAVQLATGGSVVFALLMLGLSVVVAWGRRDDTARVAAVVTGRGVDHR